MHNLRNFVDKDDIIVGIFSTNNTNIRLEIGGTRVLTLQTNKDKFTYLFDNINFVYPKMLKYNEIKMDIDEKILLICARLDKSFENIYEFKWKIDDNIYYEVANGMFLKTNGCGQDNRERSQLHDCWINPAIKIE
jgi:hypothetical protein